jgi:hypothetical protein
LEIDSTASSYNLVNVHAEIAIELTEPWMEVLQVHVSQHFELVGDVQCLVVNMNPVVTTVKKGWLSSSAEPPRKLRIPFDFQIHSWQWGSNCVIFKSHGIESLNRKFTQSK